MPQRTIAQTAGKTVVFLFITISPCLAQQFQGAVDAADVVAPEVDRRVVRKLLPVVDRSCLDFANCQIDFSNGHVLVPAELPAAALAFKLRPRMAEVDQGMQVGRMGGLRRQRRECQQ